MHVFPPGSHNEYTTGSMFLGRYTYVHLFLCTVPPSVVCVPMPDVITTGVSCGGGGNLEFPPPPQPQSFKLNLYSVFVHLVDIKFDAITLRQSYVKGQNTNTTLRNFVSDCMRK